MVLALNENSSVVNQYLTELRDIEIQKDRRLFETNVERIGVIAAYELSKQLNYKDVDTTTQLGVAKTQVVADELVICTVLRAGLPLQRGLQTIFDKAAMAFVGAARKPETGNKVEIDLGYMASPKLDGKILVLADTMLATGSSLIDAYSALTAKHGKPVKTIVVAVIASQDGVDFVEKHIPEVEIIAGAVDPELNDKFYIVPGLGDAGDLLYGSKI